jgi:hypothetical protein
VFFLLLGQLLEDAAPARVARDLRRARVELEPAALGGNRDAQRVAREEQLGDRLVGHRRTPGAARVARAMDLQHALPRREPARRRDLLDERLDVGAEEFERAAAALADEMKVARVAVRVLEAEPPLVEVHLPRDPRVHHPLQRAVDGGAADALVLPPDQIEQIVGGEVPLLAEEDVDDEVALARSLAAGRPQAVEKGGGLHRTDSCAA